MAIRDPVKAADGQDASSSSTLSPKSSLVSQVLELFPRALRAPQISRVLKRLSDAAGFISTHGLGALRGRKIPTADYHAWIAKHEARTQQWYRAIRAEVAAFHYQPRISVVLPTYNTPERYLKEAIESVRNQLYQNWELCIADDCSINSGVRDCIAHYVSLDPQRIKSICLSQQGGISVATNAAAKIASGDFLGFLDHDDVLADQALYAVVKQLNQDQFIALLFSDEDRLSATGIRYKPYFKNGWNPELMLSHNAVCHFMVVASELFWKIGGMRSQYDGAQDWDLALRASEHVNARQIRHIPQILYHWREIPGSTALRSDAKPYVRAAQIKAVSEHILRKDTEEVAIETLPYTSMLSPRFQTSEQLSAVTVVVLEDKVSAPDALKHLLSIVASGGCRTVEILVMGDSRNEGIHQQGSTCVVEGVEIKVEYVQRQPNQSVAEAFNAAAEIVSGEVLCFIQAPLVSASSGWLRELTSNVMRSSVAVAGPKILTDDRKISSAGILLAEHMALPALRGVPWSYMGDFYRGALARDVSALSEECLVVKRQAFLAVGGFDAQRASLRGFEVALSADLRESGLRTICVPKVAIVVPASWQRLRSSREKERVTQSPCAADSPCAPQCDPFWSPHIGPKGELRGS